MSLPAPQVQPYADALPYVGACDNEVRLAALERRLRADEAALFGPAETAIVALNGLPANEAHALCLLLLARRHYYNLEFEAAVARSSDAVALARIIDEPVVRAKALKFLALVLTDCGYLAEAIPLQLEALEYARTAADVTQTTEILNNLGVSLLHGARYGVAQECFEQAINLLPTNPGPWTNKAQLLLEIEEIGLSLQAAQRAVSLITNLAAVQWKIVRIDLEVILVQLRIAIGDIQKAAEHSEIALAEASQLEASHAGEMGGRLARLASLLVQAHCPSTSSNAIKSLLAEVKKNAPHFILYRTSLNIAVAALQTARRPEEALTLLREVTELSMAQRGRILDLPLPADISDRSFEGLDRLADARSRKHFNTLQVQVARGATATDEQVEYLVGLAIRAELREEDAFSSGEHAYRVARLAELLAREFGCSDAEVETARLAGLMHDLGKVFTPDQVLLKRGVLTDTEKALIKRHSEDGARLIENLENKTLAVVADAVRYSHERWDGGGYARGLRGEDIPILSRIVAICDSFDAMTHWRPFRNPRSFAAAISEIEGGSGSRYDPHLCNLFVTVVRRLHREHEDLDRFLAEGADSSPVVQEQRRLARLLRPRRQTL